MTNRATHLSASAARHGEKTALIYEGEDISFAALLARVQQTAGALSQLGVKAGSRVGIMLPSSPDFIVVQQALFALGAIVSPLNIFYRLGEISHAVRSCDLEHLVVAADLLDRIAPASATQMSSLRTVIVLGDADGATDKRICSLSAAIETSAPLTTLVTVSDADVAMLLLTSATTGKSKGVMLTAGNLAANYDRTPAWLGLGQSDVILCALPLYNTFGLNQCINAMLVTGATLVLLPRFDAERCIKAIARHGCTFLPAVPTMLQKIIDHPSRPVSALSSIKRILTGGAPVPAPLLRRVLAATSRNVIVMTGYGLTEATALVTLAAVRLGDDGEVEHGRTIGKVLDGMQLGIMDDGGDLAAAGTIGEIVVRGPNLMLGYYAAPEDTSAALTDGWLRSGDLGYIDDAGFAYIVDRKKDVIIRGGQNIYPADIEEVLYQVVGVAEAAVIGVPDEVLGEIAIAFVSRQPASSLSKSFLLDRCKMELAHYKVPTRIHFLADLPKGPTGKILKRELKLLPDSSLDHDG